MRACSVLRAAVELPVQPRARHGEEEPGHRHREQPGQGEEVAAALRGQRARITQPPAKEDEHAGEDQHRRDVERVEDDQPTTLSASNCIVPMRKMYTWYRSASWPTLWKCSRPSVSGNVTRAARTQPQKTSWWAIHRRP